MIIRVLVISLSGWGLIETLAGSSGKRMEQKKVSGVLIGKEYKVVI